MSRNENYNQPYNEIVDVVLKNALINDAEDYFGEIPSEAEISCSHSFSAHFLDNMSQLFAEYREKESLNSAEQKYGQFPENERESLDHSFWETWKNGADIQDTSTVSQKPANILSFKEQPERSRAESREQKTSVLPAARIRIKAAAIKTKAMQTKTAQRIDMPEKAAEPGVRKQKISRGWKIWRKTRGAVAAAVAVCILWAGAWQFEPIRASFKQTVLNIGGSGYVVSNLSEDDPQMLFRDPMFMPEGYEITLRYAGECSKHLKYSDGQKVLMIVYTVFDEDAVNTYDNERHVKNAQTILIKDRYEALLSAPNGERDTTSISWQNGTVQYKIYGYEPQDVLIEIAESMMP